MSINTTTIADLKTNVSSPDNLYYITDTNKEGVFRLENVDTTTVGNEATIVITTAIKRYKRIYDAGVNVKWFGCQRRW